MIIYLGPALLRDSCGLPGSLGRAVLIPLREALPYAALLQAGFAKRPRSPGDLVGSCPTVSPLPLCGAVFFSVALVHGVAPCPFSGPPCPAELGLSSPLSGSDHLTRSEYQRTYKPFSPLRTRSTQSKCQMFLSRCLERSLRPLRSLR